ncbi:hypothetical protein GYMLUDRAFT_62348 [Collybiopsis luxurians FD-317 M1]|uniref:Uncharacterized protein n=1 Tax=Collybiopsis luxurians FD-317 M1 TaxID=944289 RepID=A0A0D0AYK5_9AGAR|nr:hypothetical protein GYMLUDRAFT_62348 [Collybiopsis luxurians FD-317 M1]
MSNEPKSRSSSIFVDILGYVERVEITLPPRTGPESNLLIYFWNNRCKTTGNCYSYLVVQSRSTEQDVFTVHAQNICQSIGVKIPYLLTRPLHVPFGVGNDRAISSSRKKLRTYTVDVPSERLKYSVMEVRHLSNQVKASHSIKGMFRPRS